MRRAGWVGLGLLLAVLVLALTFRGWDAFARGIDFQTSVLEDFTAVYHPQAVRLWGGGAPRPVPGFLYPPAAALLLAPLGALDPEPATHVWAAVQLLALCLLALGTAHLGAFGRPRELLGTGLVTGLCFPVVHALHWGQVSLPLVLLGLGALLLERRGRSTAAALLLGLAGALKVYPLLLVLPWAMGGRWRPVAWTLGCALALGLGLPLALWGGEATFDFVTTVWERGRALSGAGGPWADAPNRQYVPAVLARWSGGVGDAGYLAYQALCWCAFAAVLEWVRRCVLAGEHLRPWVGLWTALPLVLSPSWPHYLAGLPLAWALAWRAGPSVPRVLVALSVVLASTPLARLVNLERAEALRASRGVFTANAAYPYLGLPAVAAGLALLALVAARRVEHERGARG